MTDDQLNDAAGADAAPSRRTFCLQVCQAASVAALGALAGACRKTPTSPSASGSGGDVLVITL